MSEKRRINLIGIGMGGVNMTKSAVAAIEHADILIGAQRMLDSVDSTNKEKLTEYRSMEILDFLANNKQYCNIAILLSGDIGFYSGAKKLIEQIDREEYDVVTECGISSLVYFASKLETSWQDALLLSSHGINANIVGNVNTHPKVFTLLSEKDSASKICNDLSEYGLGHVKISIGSDLGTEMESIETGVADELRNMDFPALSVAMIFNDTPEQKIVSYIPDEEFIRGDAPMTKSEVRSISVSKMKVDDDSVIYDIGAGTGSVSIQLALSAVNGTVYAIEKDDDASDLIEKNKRKFKTPNVIVVRGKAPDSMEDLPAPTHAFIGGSSGNLKDILCLLKKKNPKMRAVVTSVTIETLAETMKVIKECDLIEEDTICMNVSRSRKVGPYHLMTAQNPVYITSMVFQ